MPATTTGAPAIDVLDDDCVVGGSAAIGVAVDDNDDGGGGGCCCAVDRLDVDDVCVVEERVAAVEAVAVPATTTADVDATAFVFVVEIVALLELDDGRRFGPNCGGGVDSI